MSRSALFAGRFAPWLYWFGWVAIAIGGASLALRWGWTLPRGLDASWWVWADQGRYLRAAQALAQGDWSAGRQWYEPGYALLAAPFIGVTPADPFFIPDLVCYLASGMLFGLLGRRVFALGRWGGLLGVLAFAGATTYSTVAIAIWRTPWTTTPVAVLILASLVAAISFADRPRPAACFAAALFVAAIALFRPSDVLVPGLSAATAVLWTLVRVRLPARRSAILVASGLAGTALGLGLAGAAHVAIWGWASGDYLTQSGEVGFAPGLIPLRWVMLVLDPRPMLTEGVGMATVFPWFIPGLAGLVASVATPGRSGRTPHLVVAGAVLAQCLLLLSYRDLHPTGLWHFANYHYFTWLFPVLALYTLVLAAAVLHPVRRLPTLVVAAAAGVALTCWRPSLTGQAGLQADITGAHQLTLRTGTRRLADAVLVPATGPWDDIVMGAHGGTLDRWYASNSDFKAYARPGGFLLVPLRPLPAGLAIDMGPAVTMAGQPLAVRQTIAFGLPCWVRRCGTPLQLPAGPLRVGTPLVMNVASDNLISGSWELAEPAGRWLQGPDAAITVRLEGWQPGQPLMLQLRGTTVPPPRRGARLRIAISVNGHPLTPWEPAQAAAVELLTPIPAADIGPGGLLSIGLHVLGRWPDFEGQSVFGQPTLFMRTLCVAVEPGC